MTTLGFTSETSTGIRLYSRDLHARLEAETGQSTGFRPVGLIEAAADTDRLEEYRRVAAFQRRLGLEVELKPVVTHGEHTASRARSVLDLAPPRPRGAGMHGGDAGLMW